MVHVIYLLKFFINTEPHVKENENKLGFFSMKKFYILIDRHGHSQ